MNVVFAGGGTGGHLYPAIAVADALKHDATVSFVGTADRLEATIVPNAGYPLYTIAARPLTGAASPFVNAKGIAQSIGLLRRLRPDIVIATGGYVCFPLVTAARIPGITKWHVPIALLEPNAVPGLTNRLLTPMVDEVWNATNTGVPVRASLRALPTRADAAERLGLDPSRQTLLVVGGSQGARSINGAVINLALSGGVPAGWQLLLIAGRTNAADATIALARVPNARVLPYLDDMADAYAVADLVLARAGAMTIAELAAVRLPAILVPYPHAAADHQTANARAVAATGAAVLLPDAELVARLPAVFAETLAPARFERLRAAATALDPGDAVAAIVARIRALVSRTGQT
ncbi:MAG: UDP-N-acetylglucosamine--N-acetylmuramyl-(pentapeptide) pyrophosphoryl-undecaprenol N-acetylglucosamine transferase [Candidatus Eremiobacteraeota bacterium]|nr:UDP-N-acetylglucosamine--N-acetylmuramyl-(pentapeptide) pyrophosphoryl-undecaprenol N-acetylglucosamine transferase [Candidatus Eremiobacteraeota bacterium]